MISNYSRLDHLVAQFPDLAPVLEEWGIDYSGRGADTLEQACRGAGLCPEEVLEALSRARSGATFRDLSTWSGAELVTYLRNRHHTYLREELPRIQAALARVARTYGAALKEIGYIERVFNRLSQDLDEHLWKEEFLAFPWLSQEAQPDPWVVAALAQDREMTSFRLDCLRFLTNQYRVPPQTGPSYQALYSDLRAFEKDVRQYVNIENHLLFAA